ncbi:MAG: hypothetical protein HKN62_02290 [Phycisphaerales bacterium]|nr:hypothetical protein [Phycisphaerales bacterium]
MSRSRTSGLDVLTVAFATTVAMWAIGYVCRLPGAVVPAWAVLFVLLACPLAGGFALGRRAGRGVAGGAAAGAISAVLNLLVLGSVLAGDASDPLRPMAALWIPGSILASAVLAGVGAAFARPRSTLIAGDRWPSGFALVATVATLLVVLAGGLVTSLEAGLAVPDWPNSFGSNMFLYPLARMTGGVYFEHAHRLYGSLVGLTTIVLAAVIFRTDDRRWLRTLAVVAIVMVVGQGVMGGLRVTGRLTLSTDAAELTPNLALAIVHGVFGQIFLATVSLIWAFTTRTWRESASRVHPAAGTERGLAWSLLVLMIAQITFGALYRHLATPETPLPWPAHAHFTLAAIVTVLAAMVGLRLAAKHAEIMPLRRLGVVLLIALGGQLLLGLAALIAVMLKRDAASPGLGEVLLATAHQANGAFMLVVCAQIVAWTHRFLRTGG